MRFEVLTDCPRCRVESALLEAYDEAFAACRLGVPAEASCRLCGARYEGDTAADDSPFEPAGCPACGARLPEDLEKHATCSACGLAAKRVLVEPPADLADRAVLEARLSACPRGRRRRRARSCTPS